MKKLAGRKIAFLIEDGFEEIELVNPKSTLENAGANTYIISPKKTKVRSMAKDEWSNYYDVDFEVKNVSAFEFDALILPGGVINPDKLRTNKNALTFINTFFGQHKTVAAICHGAQTLINAGQVKNRRMTAVEALAIDLQNAGAIFADIEVVIDGNLITSRTPDDLPAFNKAIIAALENSDN